MPLITINTETCRQDGLCSAACPMGIIDGAPGQTPVPTADADALCIACGHCVAVCPTASLDHRAMASSECEPVIAENHISAAQMDQFLRGRRSIRRYKRRPIDRATVTRLIDLARHAPSGHNSQCVQWRVIDHPDRLKTLTDTVIEWMGWMIEQMPEVADGLHMPRVRKRYESGEDVILRGAPVVVVAHSQKELRMAPAASTIALTYLELAAFGSGLGACWAGYFNLAATSYPAMAAALALPDGHISHGAMMVGYPAFPFHRVPTRRPADLTWDTTA